MWAFLRSREDGAALVEFAIVIPVLLLIIVGLAEFGLGFKDMLSVSSATREGARVASAVGNDGAADCVIVEAAAASLSGIDIDDIRELWIYKASPSGSPTAEKQVFRPAVGTDDPAILVCSDGWVQLENNYPPAGRNITVGNLDLVGVRIIFDHTWATQVPPFTGSEVWTDDTIMRMEPRFS